MIFVGDATMSPYEIVQPGGSIEHWNEEAGARLDAAPRARTSRATCGSIPSREDRWDYTPSVQITRELIEDRMFPLTLGGLDQAIKALALSTASGCSPRSLSRHP